jgi:hypothetical protein
MQMSELNHELIGVATGFGWDGPQNLRNANHTEDIGPPIKGCRCPA